MVVLLKSGSFTANSGGWTPAQYCYGISTSKTVARSWMTALSASKASSMPPAESYVVSSTPPESIDFTHRFPRRSKILMKYFAVSAKASLLISSASDSSTLTFDIPFWTSMVERSRYVLAQKAGSTTLSAISR